MRCVCVHVCGVYVSKPFLSLTQYGKEVRLLLPVPDDVASRRKTLWKTIFEGFDRIDGIPTKAEREVRTLNTHYQLCVWFPSVYRVTNTFGTLCCF